MRRLLFAGAAGLSLVLGLHNGLDGYDVASALRFLAHLSGH